VWARVGDVAKGAWHYVLLLLAACVWGALHYLPVPSRPPPRAATQWSNARRQPPRQNLPRRLGEAVGTGFPGPTGLV
jgi:hypothetical protein